MVVVEVLRVSSAIVLVVRETRLGRKTTELVEGGQKVSSVLITFRDEIQIGLGHDEWQRDLFVLVIVVVSFVP